MTQPGAGGEAPGGQTPPDTPPDTSGEVVAPATAMDNGGIRVGTAGEASGELLDGVPTIAVYFDYICGHCGHFEELNIDSLRELAEGEEANWVLHPVSILDRATVSGTSTRAAAATAWIADRSPEHFLNFHDALFTQQPPEGPDAFTNAVMGAITV